MLFQLLALLLFCLFIAKKLRPRWKYDLHKIPCAPSLPFLGHLPLLHRAGEVNSFRGYWWKNLGYPKVMKMQVGSRTLVDVIDMECAKSVVLSGTDPLPKSYSRNKQLIAMLGNNRRLKHLLHTSQHTPYVKAIRRVYASGLQNKCLKAVYPRISEVFAKAVSQIESERKAGSVEFQSLCTKITLDVIGTVAFDTNLGGLDGSRPLHSLIIDLGHETVQSRFTPFRKFRCFLSTGKFENRDFMRKVDYLTAEWERVIEEILAREDSETGHDTIWYGLKHFVDPETGKPFTRECLLMEAATVVVAGMDTTGHQMAWILALLAANPHVTDNLMTELESHGLYGPDARQVALEDLSDLPYLAAVIKEGMRIATIITSCFIRRLPRDMTILGYRLPEGTLVAVPSNRSMNSEADWGDPDAFRPERWLTDEDMSRKYYLGFSYGPRDCIGQKLATVEMRLALIHFLVKYEFFPTVPFEKLMSNVRNGLAIEARDGIWLDVKPRAERVF